MCDSKLTKFNVSYRETSGNSIYQVRKGTCLCWYISMPDGYLCAMRQEDQIHEIEVRDSTGKKLHISHFNMDVRGYGMSRGLYLSATSPLIPDADSDKVTVKGVIRAYVHSLKGKTEAQLVKLSDGEKIVDGDAVLRIDSVKMPETEYDSTKFEMTFTSPDISSFDHLIVTNKMGKSLMGYSCDRKEDKDKKTVSLSCEIYSRSVDEVMISIVYKAPEKKVDIPVNFDVSMAYKRPHVERPLFTIPWEKPQMPDIKCLKSLAGAVVESVGYQLPLSGHPYYHDFNLLYFLEAPEGKWFVVHPLKGDAPGSFEAVDSQGNELKNYSIDHGFGRSKGGITAYSIQGNFERCTCLSKNVILYARNDEFPAKGVKSVTGNGGVVIPVTEGIRSEFLTKLTLEKDKEVSGDKVKIRVIDVGNSKEDTFKSLTLEADAEDNVAAVIYFVYHMQGDTYSGSYELITQECGERERSNKQEIKISVPTDCVEVDVIVDYYLGYEKKYVSIDNVETTFGRSELKATKNAPALKANPRRIVVKKQAEISRERSIYRATPSKDLEMVIDFQAPDGWYFVGNGRENSLLLSDSSGEEAGMLTLCSEREPISNDRKKSSLSARSYLAASFDSKWIRAHGIMGFLMATGSQIYHTVECDLEDMLTSPVITPDGFKIERKKSVSRNHKPDENEQLIEFRVYGMPVELYDRLVVMDEKGEKVGQLADEQEYRNYGGGNTLSVSVIYRLPADLKKVRLGVSRNTGIQEVRIPVDVKINLEEVEK